MQNSQALPSMGRRLGRRTAKSRSGATTVEFALVAPVFFLILFALFEFAWVNVMRHTADSAAYEACRAAMVPGATAAEAIDKANQILRMVGARGASVTVDPPSLGPDTPSVTVQVEVPMKLNAIVTPRFAESTTLRSQSTLRTERVRTR